MIFDTHVHYNLNPLLPSWDTHWQEAQKHGVTKSLVVGVDISSSTQAQKIAQSESHLFAAVGIHPHEADQTQDSKFTDQLQTYEQQLSVLVTQEKVTAIGEVGLDYFRLKKDQASIKQMQRELFGLQVKIAQKHQLPLVIHVRDQETPEEQTTGNAYWDTLEILKNNLGHHQTFILHCVSGPIHYIKEALAMGAYLGVAGNVTYKSAEHIRQLVSLAPPEQILLETDAPFLPPQNHRGQVCQPWMISQTAQYLTDNLGCDLDQIWRNSLKALKLG